MVDDKCTMVNKQNGNLANEIWASAFITQFCGITAGLSGFIYLLATRPADYSETTNFLILFTPIGVAYTIWAVILSIWLISSQINNKNIKPRSALKCIYSFFILFDIVLLAWLVSITGGPSGSIFLPIFLLIPAVATCYCDPKNWYFKAAIIMVTLVFGILVLAEAMDYAKYAKEFMVYIFSNANQIQSNDKTSSPTARGKALSGLVSIFCIVTAALCYWLTDGVRKKRRSENDCHPETCKSFYL